MLKKLSIFFVNLLIMLFVGCNIFAYNLEFNGTSDADYVVFYNIVKSSYDSRNNRGYNSKDFVEMPKRISGSSYTIVGATIQDQPSSNYGSNNGIAPIDENGYYITSLNYNVVNYDSFSGLNENNLESYFNTNSMGTVKVESKNNSVKQLQVPNSEMEISCKLYGDQDKYLITKYEIKKSFFETDAAKEIIASFKQKNGYEGVYISFIASVNIDGKTERLETAFDFYNKLFKGSSKATFISTIETALKEFQDELDKLQSEYNTIQSTLSSIENASMPGAEKEKLQRTFQEKKEKIEAKKGEIKGKIVALNWYYNTLDKSEGSVWSPYVKGVYENGVYARGYTALNDYDNILRFPEHMDQKNVYVQYATQDADGKFNLIENAPPKSTPADDASTKAQYKEIIHGYTENGPTNSSQVGTWEKTNSWENLYVGANLENVRAEVVKPYERYSFYKFSDKTYANFIRMSDEEISQKSGQTLGYIKAYAFVGDKNESYDSLWDKVKDGKVKGHETTAGNLYSVIKNTQTIIIVFVYVPGSEKTVYINFAEEDEKGNITLIKKSDGTVGVAPKNNRDEGFANVDFIHGYSETGTGDLNNYKFILDNPDGNGVIFNEEFVDKKIECMRDKTEYEEYKFKQLGKNNYAYFVKMGKNELTNLTGSSRYEYSYTLASSGKLGTKYEELWNDGKNRSQMQVISNSGTCVLPINNSNTTLITFVYKKSNNKKIFIDYVEELEDGTLSVFPVAPREQILPEYKNVSVKFSLYSDKISIDEFKGKNLSENNIYEKYTTYFYVGTRDSGGFIIPYQCLRFYYMLDDEINSKLKKLGVKNRYRYAIGNSIKVVSGSIGEDHEELLERNSSFGSYQDGMYAEIEKKNENPVLASFIYEKPALSDFELIVTHQVGNEKLPIADWAHELQDEYAIVNENGKTITADKTEAHYQIYSRAKNKYINVVETSENKASYKFSNQYQIFGYKNGELIHSTSVLPYIDKATTNKSISQLKKDFDTVKLVLYYGTNSPPSDDRFLPCPKLRFHTTNNLSATEDCENGTKGSVLDTRCYDFTYGRNQTESLKVTTDTGIYASLELPKYYVDEIRQIVNFKSQDVYYVKEKTTYNVQLVPVDRKDDAHCAEWNKKEVIDEETGEKYYVETDCKRYFQHVGYKDAGPIFESMDKETSKHIENNKRYVKSFYPNQPIESGIDLGEVIVCRTGRRCSCEGGGTILLSKEIRHYFKFNLMQIVPFMFKGYTLDKANLINFKSDPTTMIGNEQYSVLNGGSDGIEFDVDSEEIIKEMEYAVDTAYGTKIEADGSFGYTTLYCGNENEDWKLGTPASIDFISYYTNNKYTYANLMCGGHSDVGWGHLIGYRDQITNLKAINDKAIDVIFTDRNGIKPGNRYNGERLSIARAVYVVYERNSTQKNLDIENLKIIQNSVLSDERQYAYYSQSAYKYKEKFEAELKKQNETGGPPVISNGIGYTLNNTDLDECVETDEIQLGVGSDKINYKGTKTNDEKVTYSDTKGLNIVNPATLSEIEVISNKNIVAQTLGNDNSFNLQVGAETSVLPKLSQSDNVYGTLLTLSERKQYIKYYIYEMNFPISVINQPEDNQKVKYIRNSDNQVIGAIIDVSGRSDNNNDVTDRRGELKFIPNGTNGKRGDEYLTSTVDIRTDKITVTAVTKNIPANSVAEVARLYERAMNQEKYFTISDALLCSDSVRDDMSRNDYSDVLKNLEYKIRNDANYFSNKISVSTSNISRVYDFEVTDCTDVNFKNIFRKNENGVNVHTGNIYFGGIRRLNVFNYDDSNDNLVPNYNMTLPLGPYKQDEGYVDAPKIGYRISFDLKTSGFYDYKGKQKTQKRTIVIFPKFYYISKDTNTFIENVDAYYKDASGKYKKLTQVSIPTDENALKRIYQNYADGSGELSGYKIEYTPNDGYRNVLNIGITNVDDKFTKDKRTLDMSAIVLKEDMMCANFDGFIQSWYGEYKLPNSTILVKSGETNLNNNLKDGYLGVVFNIGVVEQQIGDSSNSKTVVITYNSPDKKAKSQINTSQWDYEGYLGFSNAGNVLSGNLKLQLANGTWNINNDTYQKMKGTVVLFDLDNRAASDFE